jgi:BirA family biotin operon repressor/biotin-[acetyl-CoA-carboxylase] ligase
LTVTFVFPIDESVSPHQLPLVAGLAVRNAVAELTRDAPIQLKWPNDLLYDGRKLGGLLCERVHKADLVGLGLNANLDPRDAPPGLRDRVTSLSQITGAPHDLTGVLVTAARHLHKLCSRRAEFPFPTILKEYDAHHALIGRRVSVTAAGGNGSIGEAVSGRCEGLDRMGRLLLRTRSQRLEHVISGQVQVL